jgi:hypothetical protein
LNNQFDTDLSGGFNRSWASASISREDSTSEIQLRLLESRNLLVFDLLKVVQSKAQENFSLLMEEVFAKFGVGTGLKTT